MEILKALANELQELGVKSVDFYNKDEAFCANITINHYFTISIQGDRIIIIEYGPERIGTSLCETRLTPVLLGHQPSFEVFLNRIETIVKTTQLQEGFP